MLGTWRRGFGRAAATIMAVGVVGMLIAAPTASGQAAVDQYQQSANPAGGSGETAGIVASGSKKSGSKKSHVQGTTAGQTGAGQATAGSDGGSSSGGTLPFTGYPMTALLWVVLGLFVAGLLLRLTVSMLERRRPKSAA
jgi:hypothetical protein